MRHTYTCQLRWADMDILGHVNNVVYADYLQEARVDMLRVHARGRATGELAEALLIVANRLQYVAPLVYDGEPVQIECWVTEIRAAVATIAYEVFRPTPEAPGGRIVYLRASTRLTPYVFAEERPRRFTAEEREALAVYLEESPPGLTEPTPYAAEGEGLALGHYPVQVRFSDVDIYGHVNNVKYFEYLQEARVLLMTQRLAAAGVIRERPATVVAQQDVEYKRPMLLRPAPYDVVTRLARVGRTSLTLEAEIRDPAAEAPGELMARGRVVMVFFDPATGTAVEPSDAVRAALLGAGDEGAPPVAREA